MSDGRATDWRDSIFQLPAQQIKLKAWIETGLLPKKNNNTNVL